jgi:hypothetical protein
MRAIDGFRESMAKDIILKELGHGRSWDELLVVRKGE